MSSPTRTVLLVNSVPALQSWYSLLNSFFKEDKDQGPFTFQKQRREHWRSVPCTEQAHRKCLQQLAGAGQEGNVCPAWGHVQLQSILSLTQGLKRRYSIMRRPSTFLLYLLSAQNVWPGMHSSNIYLITQSLKKTHFQVTKIKAQRCSVTCPRVSSAE